VKISWRVLLSASWVLLGLCLQRPEPAWCQVLDTAKLIEGAKKEGALLIYGVTDLRQANLVLGKFREKYPFIDAKFKRFSDDYHARLVAEEKSGKFLADVLQNNSLGLYFLKKAGLFAYYLSPEDRYYPKEFKDQGYWTTTNLNIHVLAYNTKAVARGKLPKRWEDLLNPAWKGKMMLSLREQWFAWILQTMGKDKGLNYLRELARQNLALRRESTAMRAQLVSAGESELDIDSSFGVVSPMKKNGAPIDWTALTPALAVPAGHGIAVHAPHPNAAKLFIEYLLSKEGQKTNLSFDRNVIRSDLLEEQGALKEAKLVPVDPSLGENMDYYGKQAREIFGQ
jgi:iron(III) transport system substrate-binding protein